MTKQEKLIERFQRRFRQALEQADTDGAERREASLDRIHDAVVLAGLDERQERKIMKAVEREIA